MTIPRLGTPPEDGRTYKFRPGVYAVLRRDKEVLLTLQAGETPEVQLPGGGIDPGEHSLPALHREVMEETGYGISEIRHLGSYRRFTFMPDYGFWAEKLCHIYLARPSLCKGPPLEPEHTPMWMPREVALEVISNPFDAPYIEMAFS
ncbi:NUDIX hydrolase [Alphaproteobacteria bacterium KMM 3653]|uniref:NUDIX hydrolase n=1 Tax=Harenicola maris TaxID=2841044 RepID=A0AAP2CR37_9RHOB|nr:NUDIX hydrolase [Harenicola maris]